MIDQTLCEGALHRIANGPLATNTYLLAAAGATGWGSACVVIDPSLNRDRIDAALQVCGWRPQAVLCTHGHFDHIGNAAWLQAEFGVPVWLRAADVKVARQSNFMMSAFKVPGRVTQPEFTLLDDAGAVVEAVGRRFEFHPLPGHTPGSSGIACDGLLFSGDTLYARRTALSGLPGEDHARLRQSLQGLFEWLPAETMVLPGHGPCARLADILQHNEALRTFMAGVVPQPA